MESISWKGGSIILERAILFGSLFACTGLLQETLLRRDIRLEEISVRGSTTLPESIAKEEILPRKCASNGPERTIALEEEAFKVSERTNSGGRWVRQVWEKWNSANAS